MRLKSKYTNFEGLSATHPNWAERLKNLDREQSKLWSAMNAYQDGTLFLHLEQYEAAEQCFTAVANEFEDCAEAWANVGYAQLMRYCDGLELEDLRLYKIGQIVAGGFYARPQTLEAKVRGIDEKLWNDAVKNLTRALEKDNHLVLPRANL